MTLIALNVIAYFFWQKGGLSFGDPEQPGTTSTTSSDYATIPYEITHPGAAVRAGGERCVHVLEGVGAELRPAVDVRDRLHRHVHARRPAAPRRQHAVPVDLRQQRRGLDGPGQVRALLPRSAGSRRPRGQLLVGPDSTVPNIGASGAIAGGARRLHPAVPEGARRDDHLHRLLLHDHRAAGAARSSGSGSSSRRCSATSTSRPAARAAAASRTSPTSAASSSACSRSSCSRTSASGGGSRTPAVLRR